MANYSVTHYDTLSGRVLGRYYSDAATMAEAVAEAHAEICPAPAVTYLVTERVG